MKRRDQVFLEAAWWPLDRLAEAVELVGIARGMDRGVDEPEFGGGETSTAVPRGAVGPWLVWAAGRMGLEAVPVSSLVGDLPDLMTHGGPAICEIAHDGAPGFVVLDGRKGRDPVFLCPDHSRLRCGTDDFAVLLTRDLDAAIRPEVDRIVALTALRARRRAAVTNAIVRQRLAGEELRGITMLRPPAAAPFVWQMRQSGVFGRLGAVIGLFVLLYGAEIWGWQLIGGGTLTGRLDWGWLIAWLLLLLTMIPWRLLGRWNEAMFSLDVGRLIKSRLLAGALALPSDAVKRSGVGQLISQVMESEALESLVLGGGFAVIVAVIELCFAAWILSHGAAPAAHLILLGLFAVMTVGLGLAYSRRITAWTGQRLAMTHYLIEAMVGHRTRLAQERAARRDTAEDSQLNAYLNHSAAMDSSGLRLGAGIATVWTATGLLAFVPPLANAHAPSPAALAISLGGIIFAQRALGGISGGLASLSRAGFAWRKVAEIFRAATLQRKPGLLLAAGARQSARGSSGPVLEVRNMRYAYPGSGSAVLDGANLSIERGDRILIEGPSGGGKSTLAGVLTGLRQPDSGLVLQAGLDRATLGDDWHRHVTAAPQFHENHVFSGTLAFNLLMSRQWPPADGDLEEAEELCRELDLGPLLDRMPGGIHQRVGETGWQLSHGERSRIFLARALLQRAEVTILDESFASLDPTTMDRCLRAALARAETLVVIAHP